MKNFMMFTAAMLLFTALGAQGSRFTGDFDPKKVEGKIFLIKNRANQLNLSVWEGNQSNVQMKKNTLEWEKWVFFHLGTDVGKNRHYYAIVNYGLGKVLEVGGRKPAGGGYTQVLAQWTADTDTDDAVWYMTVDGDYYNIVSSYKGHLLNGWTGHPSRRILTQGHDLELPDKDWELYEVGLFPCPTTSKATKSSVLPTTPDWKTDAKPENESAWQTVGSTKLPFFMVQDDEVDFTSRIKSSPYYKIERSQRWKHKARQGNCGGSSEVDKLTLSTEKGLSEAKSKEFSLTLGFSVTAESGIPGNTVSATLSTELGWKWSTTTTTHTTIINSREYNIPSQKVLHLWQVEEKFTLYRIRKDNQDNITSWILPVEAIERTETNCGAN